MRLEYWLKELPEKGDIPYPHFRLGVIHLMQGNFEEALREIDTCKDKFPEKKLRKLQLKSLRDTVIDLVRIQNGYIETPLQAEDSEWLLAGFDNEFELHAWKQTGIAPQIAMSFKKSGIPPKQSLTWVKANISATDAAAWKAADFEDPSEVRLWQRGDFSPEVAAVWRKLCPLPLDLVIQSRKAGFEDPELAYQWSRVFSLPFESLRWHEAGFSPDEAILWREQGFTEPLIAAKWKSEGHTPETALRDFGQLKNLD